MQATPDTSRRLSRTLDRPTLQWLDLGTRRIQEELNLVLNGGHLESVQRYDLFVIVHCQGTICFCSYMRESQRGARTVKTSDNWLLQIPLFNHDLDVRI
jgi:hypothetical protein